MNSTIAILLFLGAVLWGIFELYFQQQRRERIGKYVRGSHRTMGSVIGDYFISFGQHYRSEIEVKLVEAGLYHSDYAKYYFPLKVAVALVVIAILFIVELSVQVRMMAVPMALVLIIIVPDILLNMRKALLIKKISGKLPYLLDMMAVCVQTGMTIEASLDYLGRELDAFDKDLCYQIKRTSDSAKLIGIERALNDFSERVPTNIVQSFVLTILQNLNYGTSIAQVLGDLAEDMRKMQVLTVEEKVGKLASKMSVPLILLILMPIVALILAPGIIQVMDAMGGQ
ncbi:type II secretion system F family protein [Vibrio lentus]|uniref:type II secretion system F family protein n=1 Tax=Vibrio lentus TaxID=136468 RepID=UPI002479F74C|nr:type II secretion system F family protein [Vibrio lentus]WGS62739.1 type II secretion system F family protein [Vibrio lentus]